MSVRVDIRIDTDGNIGLETIYTSHLIDYVYLLEGLTVECLDTKLESIVYLLVGLTYTSVNDLVCRETAVMCMKHFVTTHAIGTKTLGADVLEQSSLNICLYRIMNLDIVLLSKNRNMVELARSVGASAKFTGSGGAIIGTYRDNVMFKRLAQLLKQHDIEVIKPRIVRTGGQA